MISILLILCLLPIPVMAEEESVATLIAVGDNLYHEKVINSGKQEDGSYNFDAVYANVKDYIADADIKVINQEVVLSGDSSKWGGFPSFACPLEVGEAVVRAGFNVVTHATNHSWDRGKDGALETISFWKNQDVLLTGMYDCQEDYDNIVVGEYNGIRVAFLNYTYGLNGSVLPKDSKFMVKLLNMDLVTSEIARARDVADVVIVFPHWGEEYKNDPNAAQKTMAQQMADAGADLIIGCHPHVIQPLENIVSADGRNVPCFYSLGNFVANMIRAEKCVEAMAKVRIKKVGDKVTIESAQAVPMVNFMDVATKYYTVYMADDYTEEIAKLHANGGLKPWVVDDIWEKTFKNYDCRMDSGLIMKRKCWKFIKVLLEWNYFR